MQVCAGCRPVLLIDAARAAWPEPDITPRATCPIGKGLGRGASRGSAGICEPRLLPHALPYRRVTIGPLLPNPLAARLRIGHVRPVRNSHSGAGPRPASATPRHADRGLRLLATRQGESPEQASLQQALGPHSALHCMCTRTALLPARSPQRQCDHLFWVERGVSFQEITCRIGAACLVTDNASRFCGTVSPWTNA